MKHLTFLSSLTLITLILVSCQNPATATGEAIEEITKNNFEQKVIKSSVPVVVKFHAHWCEACKQMESLDRKMAAEYKHTMQTMEYPPRFPKESLPSVTMYQVDIDQDGKLGELALSKTYGINAVPTYIFFKNGKKVDQKVGGMSEAEYRQKLDHLIK